MKKILAFVLALAMVLPCLAVAEDAAESFIYKDSVTTLATNWNPHTYQTTDDAYPADFLRSGLYTFIFNDELNPVEGKEPYTGYKIVPEMAASEPVDVTEKIKAEHPEFNIPESATSGYAYTIELNPACTWEDGTPINADTYVESLKRLLDPKLINYRATDYYSGDFCIAGAEAYSKGGNTVKNANSADGETMAYAIADLVKGEDGKYTTPDGYPCFLGLQEAYAWMGGSDSLADYQGAGYIPGENCWDVLSAVADENGFVPVTDETLAALFVFTNSDTWGNETWEQLGYYVSYEKTYDVMPWETVGILKNDEYSITLVLGKSLKGFYLLYNLSGNWIVDVDMYDACLQQTGDGWTSTYNTSVETTKSYGPYKLASYEADKSMHFVRNENWWGYTDGKHVYVDPVDGETYDMYMTTEIDTQVVAEADTRKMMFLKGQLMGYGLQAADFATYRNSEYIHFTPAETIFFLIFNGYKDVINDREANGDFDATKYDLQTMTLTSFRKAFAVAYDKELFAATISPARSGGYGLIGTKYIYDPETGARYRDTDQAKKALCDFYSVDVSAYASLDEAVDSITGYDPVVAKELFKQAFDEAIAAGYITDADNDGISDQTVRIEYCSSATSDFMVRTIAYLNEKLAEVTVGTPFEGKIEIYESAPYGTDWSNKIKSGMSDTVLAGWSGATMNPYGLSDLYVNPSYQYDAKWFDATTVDLTLTIGGEEITTNLRNWSDALNGATITVNGKEYNFGDGNATVEERLDILAGIETKVLGTYDYIPMLQDASAALLSQQVFYVVEEYNPVMGRGGIAYMKYNYNETEWADFVNSQPDGVLTY
ncbi:MAG: ABC transporter substrate-binding protein [Clostridiales bacterium]|nr:ABC transporter substrate-binding protein [Clostridiales bacterium]